MENYNILSLEYKFRYLLQLYVSLNSEFVKQAIDQSAIFISYIKLNDIL